VIIPSDALLQDTCGEPSAVAVSKSAFEIVTGEVLTEHELASTTVTT